MGARSTAHVGPRALASSGWRSMRRNSAWVSNACAAALLHRKWFLHWFQCPSCGHRSFVSRTRTSADVEARKLSWNYWCEQCHRGAALRHPRLNTYICFGGFAPTIVALFFLAAPAIGYLACVAIVLLL